MRVPRLPRTRRRAPPHHLAQQPRIQLPRQRRLALRLPPLPGAQRRLDAATRPRRQVLPMDRTPRPATTTTSVDGIAVPPTRRSGTPATTIRHQPRTAISSTTMRRPQPCPKVLAAGRAVDELSEDVGMAGVTHGLARHVRDDPAGRVPLVVLGRDRHPLLER